MSPNEKGIFPAWIDEEDIISELLRKMLSEEKGIPYSFAINPDHNPATQERMRKILARMENEKLILLPSNEVGDIELGAFGGRAGFVGYKKYKREQQLGKLSNKIAVIFFKLVLLSAGIGLLYLLLHYFKTI